MCVGGLRGAGGGSCSGKVGRLGPAGRPARLPGRRGRARGRGAARVPCDGLGGAGASGEQPKQCVLTGVPIGQWPGPSTRRARLQGPGEGRSLAVVPAAPGTPQIHPRGAGCTHPSRRCRGSISGMCVIRWWLFFSPVILEMFEKLLE